MKVLDLRCANGHTFEGWFGSEDDFLTQNGARQIECPVCSDSVIVKRLSAPRLNLGATRHQPEADPAPSQAIVPAAPTAVAPPADMPAQMQAMWMRAVRHVIANTENVGPRFADEARKIHYGETEQRGIRGQTTPQEREALQEEGIEFASMPIPKGMDEPLQ
jgi:hypothetical protein